LRRGISLRQVAPNAVTAMALCFGLTGVRFAMLGKWELAVGSVILAGVLDGLDGRIARLLNGQSRFGAELDSLSDSIAFGVSPALIIYLWSLQHYAEAGLDIRAGACADVCASAGAVQCADRYGASAAQVRRVHDRRSGPHGSGTGIRAALLLVRDRATRLFQSWVVVAPWTAFVAFLMISNLATFSWSALRLRRHVRLEVIGVAGLMAALLLTDPWLTLLTISALYLLMIPFGMMSYRRIRAAASSPVSG
jgi:CDP-diacylglycerol--serine O-phosphatidyltransferase